MHRLGRTIAPLAAVLALTPFGCVQPAPVAVIECETTRDCADGEACADGICWGNPPDITLAAVLVPPPEGHAELVTTGLETLTISKGGDIPNLAFVKSVLVSGQVMLALGDSREPLAARLVFTHGAPFRGGPEFVVSVNAPSGSYSVRLPPSTSDQDYYQVAVYPDDGTLVVPAPGNSTAAEKAPPATFTLIAREDLPGHDFLLPDPDGSLTWIQGRVVDSRGHALEGMQVFATGKPSALSPFQGLASTRTRTAADGSFNLYAPASWMDVFNIVVKPPAGVVYPTITLAGVYVPDQPADYWTPTNIGAIAVPDLPEAVEFSLPVNGLTVEGKTEATVDAVVRFHTESFDATQATTAVFETAASVDEDGLARVKLIPGDRGAPRTYSIVITPPTTSPCGSFAATIELGETGGILPEMQLPTRVKVTGTLLAADGRPAAGVQVQAAPTASFRTALSASESQLADAADTLAWPATTTQDDGTFALLLDARLFDDESLPVVYDLELIPPTSSLLPYWSLTELDFAETSGSVELGDAVMPHASHARGHVVDPDGDVVEGATVRFYELPTATATQPTARLRGLCRSGEDGEIRLSLPASSNAAATVP